MKTVAYGRVSSLEQAENQYAADQQIERLRKANPDEILFDIESGNSPTREKLLILLEMIASGQVKRVIAVRWDRLLRNDAIYIVLRDLLLEYGVELLLLDQGLVDLHSAAGELSAHIQAKFATYERSQLREKVKKGHAYRRNRNAPFGRPPWGYRVEKEHFIYDQRPLICLLEKRPCGYQDLEFEADDSPGLVTGISRYDIAKEIVLLILELKSTRRVLKVLYQKYGVPRKDTVAVRKPERIVPLSATDNLNKKERKVKKVDLTTSEELLFWTSGQGLIDWIKNPVLRGHTAYNKYHPKTKRRLPPDEWDIRENTHPAYRLLSEDQYAEITANLAARRRKVAVPNSTFYLTGLVYCDMCGYPMVLKRSPKYAYYGCRHAAVDCPNRKNIRLERLEESLLNRLFERALALEDTPIPGPEQAAPPPDVEVLKGQLDELEESLARRPNESLKQARHEMIRELEGLLAVEKQVDWFKATGEQIIRHSHTRKLAFWYTLSQEDRDVIYEKLIDRILVRDGDVVNIKFKV